MMKTVLSIIICLLFIQPIIAQVPYKKVLFDYTQNETASNSDWIIDNTYPIPSPAQSGITSGTAEDYWLGGISAWGVDLVKKGYTVHTLTNTYGITYGNTGNAYDLSNYNLFIVCEPQNLFTASEKSAILAFVQAGGGLIMVADHNNSDRDNDGYDSPEVWNDFGSQTYFGIHFQSTNESYNYISDTTNNMATSTSDSIIFGAAGTALKMSYNGGSTMSLYNASNASALGHVWETGVAKGTTRVMAATATYGLGRVGACGDSSPADDGSAQPGNSNIYNGWTAAGITNNIVLMNMSIWAASAPRSVTNPPTQVSLLSPANTATGVSLPVTLRWYKTDSTTKYNVQVSTSNTFASFIVNDSTLTDTTKAVSTLSANTTYYWRVRSGNTGGWGTYSSTWSFSSWTTPAQVTTISPANLATGLVNPLTFQWNKVSGATNYNLQISTSNTFVSYVVNDTTLTDSISSKSGLSAGTTYYWRVRAKNSAGWGTVSTTASFTTLSVPTAITTVYPASSATGVGIPVPFLWNIKSGITNYNLQVSTSNTFSTFIVNDTTLVDTFSVASNLNLNTMYYWKVRAKNPAGWGAYSSVINFTTANVPATATTVFPANNTTWVEIPVAFRWNIQSSILNYQLQVSTSNTFTSFVVDDSTLTDTTSTISNLNLNTLYYWRVRSKNASGWGAYSTTANFTTWDIPAQVTAIYPADNATVRPSFTFLWQSSPDVDTYHFELSTSPSFETFIQHDTLLTVDSLPVTGLDSGAYYWRVRAKNGAGIGAYSTIRTFNVLPTVSIQSVVNRGWNLVSIPVILDDMRKISTYNNAISNAFKYQGGYLQEDTLVPGVGYWIKYDASETVSVTGYSIDNDTIDVKAGWNLIGALSTTIPTACVEAIGTTILSDFFGYNSGYALTTELQPMKAYWVKVSTSGKLVLPKSCVMK